MGRKGAISGAKGAVTGRKAFGLVKGRRFGREWCHFFVGRTPKRTKRALFWKEKVHRHWPKGAISALRGTISVPKSVVTAR